MPKDRVKFSEYLISYVDMNRFSTFRRVGGEVKDHLHNNKTG